MQNLVLTISDVSIRQDDQGRYCLNDLHKAAGNESRHQPAKWLITQQAVEFIELLKSEESITGIPVIFTKQGLGTFVIKELVYSYAMWISAKFHLAVIRAYDALVTGKLQYGLKDLPKAPRAKLALPGCLTLEEQDLINDTIAERLATLPKEKQGKAAMLMRSALVTKWELKGVKNGYKNIPSEQFTNVLNFIHRLELDGDNYLTLPKDELNRLLDERVHVELKALASPVKEGEVMPKPTSNTLTVDLNLPTGMTQLTYHFNTEGTNYGRWLMCQSDGSFTIRVMGQDEFFTSSQKLPQHIADSMSGLVKKSDLPSIIKSAADRL